MASPSLVSTLTGLLSHPLRAGHATSVFGVCLLAAERAKIGPVPNPVG